MKTQGSNRCIPGVWRAVCALLVLLIGTAAGAAEITDMFGRKFTVQDKPRRVYSASPPMTYLLYALDPTMLAGLNFPVREWQKTYLDKRMQALPVLGGWYGQSYTPNFELVLKTKPEIILTAAVSQATRSQIGQSALKTIPIPVIDAGLDRLAGYSEVILRVGRLLGREQRAKDLAAYADRVNAEIAAFAAGIPERKRVSVYYAEGVDGLRTDGDSSRHAELIRLVGARNVHRSAMQDTMGQEMISLEKVLLYDPDVIIVLEPVFFKAVFSDPRWQRIKAVREKRVYLIPRQPFNWFDRPPSFMRLLGAKWLAHTLYPATYRIDMVRETQEFFKLFLGVDIGAAEAGRILRPVAEGP
jgi:iron complex transport system substrate-binding protein